MISININELEDFKNTYDTDISTSLDYLKIAIKFKSKKVN